MKHVGPINLLSKGTALAGLLAMANASSADLPAEQRLLLELDVLRRDNDVAAMGLVIVQGDQSSLLATMGLADRAGYRAIGDDAIFRIGSISKMFTGLLAAEMEARGALELDTPINHWPLQGTYSNRWHSSHPVTTAQLLEHSAGFTGIIRPEWDYSDPRQLPLRETLRMYPQARVTQWQPGMHYSYSNAGPGLAGHVLELAGKKSYEKLMQDNVLGPLQMNDTTVLPPASDRLPTGYDTDGDTPIPYWHQIFRPFAAINSTLADMSRFIRVFINEGIIDGQRLFRTQVIRRVEMPTTTLAARRGLNYGYGLGSYTWLRDGIVFHGHGGDADGYLSRMAYTRHNNSGYFLVITAFQNNTLRQMRKLVEHYLTKDLPKPEPPAAEVLDAKTRQTLSGGYRRITRRFPATQEAGERNTGLRVFEKSGQLYSVKDGGRARLMVPVVPELFRRSPENHATFFAGAGEDGGIYFQEDSDNYIKLTE